MPLTPTAKGLSLASALLLSACASQAPPVEKKEATYSVEQQRQAQAAMAAQQPEKLSLKRKIALGRISNETLHGKSLLRDNHNDVLGKQVADMLSKALTESGNFLVFERPDLGRVEDEAKISGQQSELVGVDALLIGSLTEFGRRTTGESGFLSSSKKQSAIAKIDLRLVDTRTAQIVSSFSGSGEASTESVNVAGFGSKAAYDAAINDKAISIAVAESVNSLTQLLSSRPWQSTVLALEGQQIFISGGANQGIKEGMQFDLVARGKRIKSAQTGAWIELPGKKVASIKITSLFGQSDLDQGSVAILTEGSIQAYDVNDLLVQEQ